MPIHDWSRVFDGAFHAFHHSWITVSSRTSLNSGILPPDYYAMAEQVARPTVPDVLTLQAANGAHDGSMPGRADRRRDRGGDRAASGAAAATGSSRNPTLAASGASSSAMPAMIGSSP